MPQADVAADFAPVRFSTADFPERERLTRWREAFGRGMARLDIEPLSSDIPFHAEAIVQALPGVRTACCTNPAARLIRTQALAADGDASIVLLFNLDEASASVAQRGKGVVFGRGDAIPVLVHEPSILTSSTKCLGIMLPLAALAKRVDNVEDAAMRVIPNGVEPLLLLASYLKLVQEKSTLGMAELRQTVVSHIHDLAALALGANRETRESGLSAIAAARLAAALRDIAKSFAVPGLTLEAIARRQGISPRYLQRLLEMSGTSFRVRVNELRLQRAFALLSTGPDRRRIADIAMEAGFSDVTHFNRLFRARFGETPSGVRPLLLVDQ
jgi:AraC-like DNA-binding protein